MGELNNARYQVKIWHFLAVFMASLREQLMLDERRYKNTWLVNPREGMEDRIFDRFDAYYRDWVEHGAPVPWLKIAGNALIGWVRDTYPSMNMTEETFDAIFNGDEDA